MNETDPPAQSPDTAAPSQALPPLTWLRAFEATTRHLSFTRAAQELNLTQSAVSQHVRSLEAFLGRDLFIRKTRMLELTEDGGNYVPVVREAFNLLASGTQAFTGNDRGRSMVLQCNLAFSVFWLAPRLKRLYAQHPWLTLNIVTPIWDPERHASNAAMEIRFGRPTDMSGAARQLTRDQYFPVCAPSYRQQAEDLSTATLFDCAGVTGSWSTWLQSHVPPRAETPPVNLTSTYVIAMQVALSGGGLALSHDTLAKDLLRSGDLIAPYPHRAPLSESYFLHSPSEHMATPATRAFEAWIMQEFTQFEET
ncbi:LysR family transcriptional regulator [Phaeobacter sp.]|uniref:LysR family transcriptional regulator n=1 Tax=Phaeobacter sp. TaxID=1902409 RepID=UPI0025DF7BC2|nr:LysR family transcriptional regulator [Phaeobacter sp.]